MVVGLLLGEVSVTDKIGIRAQPESGSDLTGKPSAFDILNGAGWPCEISIKGP